MTIHAYETLDCASKVRVHYLLAQPVSLQSLSVFPEDSIEVSEFSRQVQGAKDHFTVTLGSSVRAAGGVGECKMVVTYGKTSRERPVDEIRDFEARLRSLDGEGIEYHRRREDVV